MKHYLVYKTTNLKNGKFYIGSHQTEKIDDSYLGSGKVLKKAIRKYGRSNFSREIIAICVSYEVMRSIESQLVKFSILNFGRMCYNRSFSGTGAMLGTQNSFYGKQHSDSTKKIISEIAKTRTGNKNPFFGRKHSDQSKEKMKLKNVTTDTCKNMLDHYLRIQKIWWCTPAGCFYSANYAAKFNDVSSSTIKSRCNNPDKIVARNYQTPEEYWGKTWREVGYYIVDKITV